MADSRNKTRRKPGSGQHARRPPAAPDPDKVAAAKAQRRAEAEANAERRAAAAAARARRRRNRGLTFGAIGLVVVVVAIFVVVKVTAKPAADTASGVQAADPAVVAQITAVPATVLDRVGDGGIAPQFFLPAGNPAALTQGGLPRVLYVGGLFCPFCATQRWPMIAALSRFGTFSGLRYARSATTGETVKNIHTFDLSGVTFTSSSLSFTPYENEDRNHQPLDTVPDADNTLMSTYDASPTLPSGLGSGTIPFVDLANRWVMAGASYDAPELQGKTWAEIAGAATTGTGVGRQLDGTVNWLTAAFCTLAGNKPASVCADPVIAGLQARLPVPS